MMPPRPALTHFLCLPLVTTSSRPLFLASLERFTGEAVDPAEASTVPIPEKAVRPLGTLHLTIGVMSLQTQDRIDACLSFLRGLDVHDLLRKAGEAPTVASSSRSTPTVEALDQSSIAVPTSKSPLDVPTIPSSPPSPPSLPSALLPLTISLLGLHPMHSPSSTSILYALPSDPTCRLSPFCQSLQQLFTSAGFLLPDDRPLRLHATIVNTIYAKDKNARARGDGHGRGGRGKRGFDARVWIERYEGFEWAAGVRLEKVAICEMGARKVEGDGVEYLEIGSVSLP